MGNVPHFDHAYEAITKEVRHGAAINVRPFLWSPHHVKVSLTIGTTTSLVKRVPLKGALTHSAHMMLHVRREDREIAIKCEVENWWQNEGKEKTAKRL